MTALIDANFPTALRRGRVRTGGGQCRTERCEHPIHVTVLHRRKHRQAHDAAPDALGIGKIPGTVAKFPEQSEQMHRRVVHTDSDTGRAHRGDKGIALDVFGQQHLKHVPVALRKVFERQLASQRAIEARKVASRQFAPARGECIQVRQLAQADAGRNVGEIVLAAGERNVHPVPAVATALDPLQAPQLAAPRLGLIVQHQAAAFARS